MVIDLETETGQPSISLHIPNIVSDYIETQNVNRSEWVIDAGSELLKIIEDYIFPKLNSETNGSRIVSISKPPSKDVKKIYSLIKQNKLTFGRSEFYRLAIFIKMLLDTIKEEHRERKVIQDDPNTIKIPEIDENGNGTFKVYKILKRLEY